MRSYLRHTVICALTLATVIGSSVFGQGNDPIEAGKKSVQFQIGPNIELSSLEGTAITFKKHTSETKAWRIGISPTALVSDRENTSNDTVRTVTDEHRYGLSVVFQMMRYRPVSNNATFFYGYGPRAGFKITEMKQENPLSSNRVTDQDSYFFGGSFTAGVEWFVTKSVGISGEYGLNATYEHSEATTITTYPSQPTRPTRKDVSKRNYFSFNASQVKLGVSIYFN